MNTKNLWKWGFVLFFALVLASCSFGPDNTGKANTIPEMSDQRNFLAALKAMGNYTIDEAELERQILQCINPETAGRGIAPNEKTIITGSRKLPVSAQRIANRSSYARSAVAEADTVEIYEFTTENTVSGEVGYVLASDDIRIGHFLAMTDGSLVDAEGEFGEYFNIALQNYIDSIVLTYNDITEAEVEAALAEVGAETETVQSRISGPYNGNPDDWYHHATTTNVAIQKSPLLMTNWGQGAPYNAYIQQRYGTGIGVGCATVAIAQIVAYNNYINPNAASENRMAPPFNNAMGNWTGQYNFIMLRRTSYITNSSSAGIRGLVSALMYHVMREGMEGYYAQEAVKNRDPSYSITAIYTGDFAQIFRNLGYTVSFADDATSLSGTTNGSWSITYHSDSMTKVKNALNNNNPVLMRGAAIDITTNKQKSGHAWVVDGYGTVTSVTEHYKYIGDDSSKGDQSVSRSMTMNNVILVHCNLGWDGYNAGYAVVNGSQYAEQNQNNPHRKGWFIYGIFDTNNLSPENKDIRKGNKDDGYNFSNNTYIVIPEKP